MSPQSSQQCSLWENGPIQNHMLHVCPVSLGALRLEWSFRLSVFYALGTFEGDRAVIWVSTSQFGIACRFVMMGFRFSVLDWDIPERLLCSQHIL